MWAGTGCTQSSRQVQVECSDFNRQELDVKRKASKLPGNYGKATQIARTNFALAFLREKNKEIICVYVYMPYIRSQKC